MYVNLFCLFNEQIMSCGKPGRPICEGRGTPLKLRGRSAVMGRLRTCSSVSSQDGSGLMPQPKLNPCLHSASLAGCGDAGASGAHRDGTGGKQRCGAAGSVSSGVTITWDIRWCQSARGTSGLPCKRLLLPLGSCLLSILARTKIAPL